MLRGEAALLVRIIRLPPTVDLSRALDIARKASKIARNSAPP